MGKKRDILTEFTEYYASLSADAQDIVRRLVLQPPSKSSSPVKPARNQSSSRKRGLPGATPSTSTDTGAAGAAQAASGSGD